MLGKTLLTQLLSLSRAAVFLPGTRGLSWQIRAKGKGCGEENERQKEAMLIMYLNCEVSAGLYVRV